MRVEKWLCLVILVVAFSKAQQTHINKHGNTQLHSAAFYDCAEIVDFWLKKGVDVNVSNGLGNTPLHFAADQGCHGVIQQLIKAGADVNVQNNRGLTPLHLAVNNRDAQTVSVLMKFNADTNVNDEQSMTPLHTAVVNNDLAVLRQLLKDVEGNRDAKALDSQCTSLHFAVNHGHWQAAQLLMKAGANPNMLNKNGDAPLHVAAYQGDIKCINALTKYDRCNVNIQNSVGATPLHLALQQKKVGAADALLNCPDVDVDVVGNSSWAPLHLAASKNLPAQVRSLVWHGANVNIQDKDGNTPLHIASFSGLSDMANVLVNVDGCEINLRNKAGFTPLDIADWMCQQGGKTDKFKKIIACLESKSGVITELMQIKASELQVADLGLRIVV